MRFLFTSLITLLGGTVAIAHNEVPDSIAARELDEIVVQAPRVIRKADMDVFYPSQTAVEYSKNGMQMLRNLMIPTLNVDDFSGTVKSSGQSVQLRINGRVATTEQVQCQLIIHTQPPLRLAVVEFKRRIPWSPCTVQRLISRQHKRTSGIGICDNEIHHRVSSIVTQSRVINPLNSLDCFRQ